MRDREDKVVARIFAIHDKLETKVSIYEMFQLYREQESLRKEWSKLINKRFAKAFKELGVDLFPVAEQGGRD